MIFSFGAQAKTCLFESVFELPNKGSVTIALRGDQVLKGLLRDPSPDSLITKQSYYFIKV